MGAKTKIAWTDATWSCLRGCSRTIAPGANGQSGCGDASGGGCYAERNGWRFAGPGLPYEGLVRMTPNGPRWTGEVLLVDKHLLDPIRWAKPRRIFTTSVSDPFHERYTNETIALLFGVMAVTRRHIHQCLTKRSKRMREWFAWAADRAAQASTNPAEFCFSLLRHYVSTGGAFTEADRKLVERLAPDVEYAQWPLPNVWLGVSVENQAAADTRIPDLLATPTAVRFLSCEPLLGQVNLSQWLMRPVNHISVATGEVQRASSGLSWCIAGAESGPGSRTCDEAWLRSLLEQCREAGVPFFLKQMVVDGTLRTARHEFPGDLQVQEFPR